ncbi:MAG: thiamine-binding protein [Spirochaetaceae bacterium]|jgi:uncharacterized protein YqgV (UPF0045/DUF77 family)|nr:thiamine-binding protein [Spirochaetaceae bacterium]
MANSKQPEASMAIQVLPKTAKTPAGKFTSGEELLRIVDAVIGYIKSTGLNYFVGPFETTVEGDFDRLCQIAAECQKICIREGAESVSSYIKFVYNPHDGVWPIDMKVSKYHA